nr:hypothetical protein [Maliibacterium massiliense]
MDVRKQIIEELKHSVLSVKEAELDTLCDYILQAPKVIVYSRGRVGLAMKAFAMRLNHLGLCGRFLGDITTPAIGKGDLLLVGTSLGFPSSFERFMDIAHYNGASVIGFTSNPEGPLWQKAEATVNIPARAFTSHPEEFEGREITDPAEVRAVELLHMPSVQPMCSTFEQALLLVLDYTVLKLQQRLGQSEQQLRDRHANIL